MNVLDNSDDSSELSNNQVSEPYHFNTIDDMILAMEIGSNSAETKSDDAFVSYADAVMSMPGYYDNPNVIYSERFGSILNSQGEVFVGNTCVKVCPFGVLYGPISEIEQIRTIACHQYHEYTFREATESPLEMSNMDGLFVIDDYQDIYVFDSFNLLENDAIGLVETKSVTIGKTSSELFGSDDTDKNWTKSFKYPRTGEQKQRFACNSKVANDTKVYQTNVGIYVETGIKVKTMKKNGLGIWKKFDNPTTAVLGNLAIMEYWDFNFSEAENGWIDINYVKYDNSNYTVATIKIDPDEVRPPMDYSLSGYIRSAKTWARNLGYNIESIDAIRFVTDNTGNIACVRFADKSQTENDGKSTIIFDFKYGGDKFSTGTPIVVGNAAISKKMKGKSFNYEVMGFFALGYSDYGGERQQVQFNYYGGL